MTISSLTSARLSAVAAVPSTNTSISANSPGSSNTVTGDSTRISSAGRFLTKLQDLEKSDPAKAKQVLSDIADKLNAQAQQVGGDQGQKLSSLAAKFQNAANTGDLSALQGAQQNAVAGPTQGAHHHGGGHHHKAQAAYAQQQDQSSPLDDVLGAIASTTSASA